MKAISVEQRPIDIEYNHVPFSKIGDIHHVHSNWRTFKIPPTGLHHVEAMSNFDEVFDSNDLDAANYSDYNQIKDNVHSKLRG